jgi:hypothetical protein
MAKPVEVSVQSQDLLRKLYEVFDELGMVRQFSERYAELEIKINATWVLFYVDRAVLEQDGRDVHWQDDAERVAEGYWRE